mmetsp:Transcript_27632/g.43483  ORF Transcript_27632/g.43483 Transcript_27632/m.43483 type:complete len:216 (-) Transcript_27632:45-692(-)
MSRWAPFIAWIGLAGCRHKSSSINLGHLVLKHLQSLFSGKARVLALEEFKSIITCRETVHQHKLDILSKLLPHAHDLLGGKIKESITILDLKQRLRLVKSHTSSKTTIKLEHNSLGKKSRVGRGGNRIGVHKFRHGSYCRFGDDTSVSRHERFECRFESGDGRRGNALFFHLGPARFERCHVVSCCCFRRIVVSHGIIMSMFRWLYWQHDYKERF